jgi:hypothetical protein
MVIVDKPVMLLRSDGVKSPTAANVVTINFAIGDGPHGKLLPLFTGLKQARDFIDAMRHDGEGVTPVECESLHALEALLRESEKSGITHINFNGHPRNPDLIPIEMMIESVQGQTQEEILAV